METSQALSQVSLETSVGTLLDLLPALSAQWDQLQVVWGRSQDHLAGTSAVKSSVEDQARLQAMESAHQAYLEGMHPLQERLAPLQEQLVAFRDQYRAMSLAKYWEAGVALLQGLESEQTKLQAALDQLLAVWEASPDQSGQ